MIYNILQAGTSHRGGTCIWESFQKLNLTNAYLFAAALQDEEICRNLLEIVLNKEIPRVKAHAEHTLFLDSDFKSVRFDVYASG